eukprot:SAG22_NODE_4184_length_1354_cov_2.154582_1_plen_273_part_01
MCAAAAGGLEYVRSADGQWVAATPAELLTHGSNPIVVSAPHSLPLFRDGHADHKKEDYTRYLAACFAEQAGGAALCWQKEEEARLKAGGNKPDRRNRDPNHLPDEEATTNWWAVQLRQLLAEHTVAAGLAAADPEAGRRAGVPCLHVDVHGAQDPAEGGRHKVHVHLGLAAMERAKKADVEEFRDALADELGRAFWRHWNRSTLGGFVLVDPNPPVLTGALAAGCGRRTLSQQSIHAGWTHAVQLELSHTVRIALFKEPALRRHVMQAIKTAW